MALKRHIHSLACLLVIALAAALGPPTRAQSAQGAPRGGSIEYPVKATYLYKFASFVDWPAAAFASPASPLEICLTGDDPFGAVLDRATAGQRIGARPVVVRRLPVATPAMGCHILYVAGSKAQPAADGIKTVRGNPVLTVTDAALRPTAKGVVHFVVTGNRVRFEIDPAAAAANQLTISSKLQSLALPGSGKPVR